MDTHEHEVEPIEPTSFLSRHRFLLLIALTIMVALGLVSVSLVMYNVSGAALLDFSRPGFQSVASQADKSSANFKTYSSSGPVNAKTIQEFQSLYDAQAKSVKTVDAFGSDPLNADTIEFGTENTKANE